MPALPLSWKLAAVLGVLVTIGGFYLAARHDGARSERNAAAADTLEQVETDRKDREKNDATTRTLDDDAALKCLRNPQGCR